MPRFLAPSALLGVFALALAPPAPAAEVVARCKKDFEAMNFTLFANLPGKRIAYSPDNGFEEQIKGIFRWSKVPDGEYRIIADPDYEDWSAHWIGVQTVIVKDGAKVETEFTIPDGTVMFSVDFWKLPEPAQKGMDDERVFRVDRLLEKGQVDPFFRQWLWAEKKEGRWVGEVDYLDAGRYRISAFGVDEGFEMTPGPHGDVEIEKGDLDGGEVRLQIDTPVKVR